jgi:pantoate--beta-alanine ligase
MHIVRTWAGLRKLLADFPPHSQQMGFVPTMGALHQGHLALVQAARNRCTRVVVSIFVNPTQFNDPADYARYPVSLEQDIDLLEGAGCDILFLPELNEIYQNGLEGLGTYDLGPLDGVFEGLYRPGHLQGVCQVVHRLLQAVQPGVLVMGQKDYQQCMVVRRLIHIAGLPVNLVVSPTIREADGLAMSSRNRLLTPEQRAIAPYLYKQLQIAALGAYSHSLPCLEQEAIEQLRRHGFSEIHYFQFADAETLVPVSSAPDGKSLVLVAAALLDSVRLIDNLTVPDGGPLRTA